jgi:hypothetical protein
MQSLLDYIYPVGSIYLSYSHVSPADLFGGTWVRMENAFLWGTTSGGTIGQTGGSQNHTHTLEAGYAKIGMGWSSTVGNSIGYANSWKGFDANMAMNNMGAFATGSGAENYQSSPKLGGSTDSGSNMPPYIQVSIWRRTA